MGDPFSTDPKDIVLPPMSGYEMMLTGLNPFGCMSPSMHLLTYSQNIHTPQSILPVGLDLITKAAWPAST